MKIRFKERLTRYLIRSIWLEKGKISIISSSIVYVKASRNPKFVLSVFFFFECLLILLLFHGVHGFTFSLNGQKFELKCRMST